ncbi:multisubunit sodium/proton antiporter, MrpA subunit /multisubunit sodium/proton antiporter, MrpB subunit [Quadrisphaera granulorum]|uniref:Multisubunit sodium/proton antiporter MrpA subunit /multisubunit sodium/proton antiporter MrpB subunit n=1 Tax=Quadrisphaera granulorum TaxID=317664 RepID=A0A316ADB0_9ACTN|nr:Na+/H+ antiporter subunit A [Quadrisphaera granulorum]PWJ55723.1 multisubunit sodium/proton antiporter MrpA subunit /multisubunit sodium/proton antiporter MrpB subunit [Quadrisphaera granulorum]SZE95220.1 multisubunit sodium/proton antiporter, MrpA subunit /multisubunit sodium/proton antiporter, MrpB subunit [Quadrisphaera granulorum]
MILLLTAHCAAAALAVPVVRRWGPRGVLLTALAPLAVLAWLIVQWASGTAGSNGSALRESVPWIPDLGVELALRLDPLSAIMVLIVAGVGALVLAYSSGYFAGEAQARTRQRTVPLLVAFCAVMLVLVLADDLVLLYVAWELTTVLSWLLIGGDGRSRAARYAASQALVVTTAGGLAMLVGIVILAVTTGTTSISALLADPPPAGTATTAAALLLLAGAVTKSALLPTTAWLPGAMVAPTPISAYLHAAAMVKAGVYLIARFGPVFTEVPAWRWTIVVLGGATMIVGAWRALRQHDLKLLLAHGTVSELGFIALLVGAGGRTGAMAGVGLLLAHAMFKSCLFMVVGAIDHGAHTRDLRKLSGLARRAPALFVASLLAAGSMAGVPPMLGFITHEAAFEGFVAGGGWPPGATAGADLFVLVVLLVGSVLTAAYSARFVWGAFATRELPEGAPDPADFHAPSAVMLLPLLVAAGGGLFTGLFPAPVDGVVAAATSGFPAPAEGYYLALWHGFTPTLALSAVALGLGAVFFAARAQVLALQRRLDVPALTALTGGRLQDRARGWIDAIAATTTLVYQRGSLPQYVLTAAAVLVLGPGSALVVASATGSWPAVWRWWDEPLQAALVVVALVTAVATAATRNRRAAFVMAGVSGYAVAGLFVVAGAPDVALTQALVESVTLAAAVLVLRGLPSTFEPSPDSLVNGPTPWLRALLAIGAGAVASLLAAVALSARQATPVSVDFAALAYKFGYGENVVNVTLVDLRAWDTFGEITVLTVAATGIASLVFLRHRTGRAPRLRGGGSSSAPGTARQPAGATQVALTWRSSQDFAPGPDAAPSTRWLPAVKTLAPARRSLLLEIVVRLVFGTVLVLGVYLLFAGHNLPGGGFAAGLVTGLALFLRYLAGGRYELGEAARVDVGVLLGSGLLIAAASTGVPLLLGAQATQTADAYLHIPLLGEVHLVSSLAFDVGVYLVVVGTVLDVLRSLGAGIDAQQEEIEADPSALHDHDHDDGDDDGEPGPDETPGPGIEADGTAPADLATADVEEVPTP